MRVVAAATTATAAATTIDMMFTLTLCQHTSLKKIITLFLPAPALTVAQIMQITARGEVRRAQADFQAVRSAPIVGGL